MSSLLTRYPPPSALIPPISFFSFTFSSLQYFLWPLDSFCIVKVLWLNTFVQFFHHLIFLCFQSRLSFRPDKRIIIIIFGANEILANINQVRLGHWPIVYTDKNCNHITWQKYKVCAFAIPTFFSLFNNWKFSWRTSNWTYAHPQAKVEKKIWQAKKVTCSIIIHLLADQTLCLFSLQILAFDRTL